MDSDLGEEDIVRETTVEAGKVFGESDIWRKARRSRERGETFVNEQNYILICKQLKILLHFIVVCKQY